MSHFNGTVHKFLQNFTFRINICHDLWIWSKVVPRKIKNFENHYVQSQWRVVLLWFIWPSSIQRGRHTQLCIITSLKWIIQICSNLYCWVSIFFFVWGNFPFKKRKSRFGCSTLFFVDSSKQFKALCNKKWHIYYIKSSASFRIW